MKSIAFVHKDMAPTDMGGLSVLFKTLASGLAREGWAVHALSTHQLMLNGVVTHQLPKRTDPFAHSNDVAELLATLNLDIVECSNWRYELLSYMQKPERHSKVVVRCDPCASTLFEEEKESDVREAALCQGADRLLAVSGFAKRDVESKYNVRNVRLVYNGVSSKFPHTEDSPTLTSGEILLPAKNLSAPINSLCLKKLAPGSRINVLWVGKFTSMKGFDLFEKIVEQAPPVFNFIANVGYAPAMSNWKKENYNRCTFIRGLSKREQVSLWRSLNVALITSRVEGFCLALAEALSLGLPIVANIHCDIFHEFLPNPALALVDMFDPQAVLHKLAEMSYTKVSYSRLPSMLSDTEMIKQSIDAYEELL